MRENSFELEKGAMDKPVVFKLVKKARKPALKGRHYPSIMRLPSEERVFDPVQRATRVIRYAPGEQSIYKDEQPEKVVLGDIVFQNGSLIVPFTNPLLQEYLSKSNYNTSNPARIKNSKQIFTLLDPEGDAEKAMEREVEEIRAGNVVMGMDFDELKGYARILGVDINMGAKMIRHEMLRRAKKNPDVFMAGLDDPTVKRQQVLLDAKDFNIIKISPRAVSWLVGGNESLIVPVPIGQEPAAWFAEWTMNDKDGEKVYAEIEKKVKALSE